MNAVEITPGGLETRDIKSDNESMAARIEAYRDRQADDRPDLIVPPERRRPPVSPIFPRSLPMS
ncbi:MAG: hypothetical protein U5K56_06905 [Halioglobus sp.]|nr:hypothetical protein [Halioglobus sp.]